MNTSGEAADQVMRMMLNGTEVLVKLTGSGAKNAAVLLLSALRQQKKTKGKARLENMLRSGKPLKVYTFKDSDLAKFKEVAKEYGILYTVLKEKDKTGGVFDVMVRAEDESKIARITERFDLARVNSADIRADIIREKETTENGQEVTEKTEISGDDEMIVDEILGTGTKKEGKAVENPLEARAETVGVRDILSERSYATVGSAKEFDAIERKTKRKPSVRKSLEQIRHERAKEKSKSPELAKGIKTKER